MGKQRIAQPPQRVRSASAGPHDSQHHCQNVRKRRVEVSWKCNRPGPGNGSRYSEQVLVRRLRPTELCKVWLPGVVSALRSNLVQRLATFEVPLLDRHSAGPDACAHGSASRQQHVRSAAAPPSRGHRPPQSCGALPRRLPCVYGRRARRRSVMASVKASETHRVDGGLAKLFTFSLRDICARASAEHVKT